MSFKDLFTISSTLRVKIKFTMPECTFLQKKKTYYISSLKKTYYIFKHFFWTNFKHILLFIIIHIFLGSRRHP